MYFSISVGSTKAAVQLKSFSTLLCCNQVAPGGQWLHLLVLLVTITRLDIPVSAEWLVVMPHVYVTLHQRVTN
jgi:hypothetical protein